MPVDMEPEKVPSLQLRKRTQRTPQATIKRPRVHPPGGHSLAQIRGSRGELIQLQGFVERTLNGWELQIQMPAPERGRELPFVQLTRALAYHHVEVWPGTLPRTSGVIQASSRPAQWPRMGAGTVICVGETLEGRPKVLMVTGVVDVSGQHSRDGGQMQISNFRIYPI